MSKVADYLQEHINGEVVATTSARRYFATDGGVFEVAPQVVLYPKNTGDVRKIAHFAYQLALKGHKLSLTARGRGTDQTGAAIGRGAVVVFPAHMNRILEMDASKGFVRVQPGTPYRNLQDVLHSHGLFLPPFPASIDFCSIGGAIANNAAGEKSVKYGDTRKYTRSLQVVLANGDLIETRRLSKRELSAKKGQTDAEGEIYRDLDNLITDNKELIEQLRLKSQTSKNASGYALGEVKHKDGSFDLTPLLVGAQGTLGLITEATLEVEGYNPRPSLLAAQFDTLEKVSEAIENISAMQPSAMEIVDKHLLEFMAQQHANMLKGILDDQLPAFLLLIEFDDPSDRARKKHVKKASKVLSKLATSWQEAVDPDTQMRLWDIRHSAATVLRGDGKGAKALPIIEDGIVPKGQFAVYVAQIYKLFKKHNLQASFWGHAGDANLHVQPYLNLSKLTDRQKTFQIMDDYYAMLAKLGGSMSAEHGDGRLRGPYLEQFYGKDIFALFKKVKEIFDPQNILNPGVKLDATKAEAMTLLRRKYDVAHLNDHLPQL